jgi:hypothetical protein
MNTKESARWQAGAESICAFDSTETPVLRHRVQLSAHLACTFEAAGSPLRLNVHWHGKPDPKRVRGLALARYRRARDAFLERLALAYGANWLVAETDTGYSRIVGLASCEPREQA